MQRVIVKNTETAKNCSVIVNHTEAVQKYSVIVSHTKKLTLFVGKLVEKVKLHKRHMPLYKVKISYQANWTATQNRSNVI